MPVGPIELLDDVGIDVAAKAGGTMSDAWPERMPPDPTLEKLVTVGRIGRKAKKGFYFYEGDKRGGPDPAAYAELGLSSPSQKSSLSSSEIQERLVLPMINEAAYCLAEGIVASPAKLDLAMIFGTGFPPFRGGLCAYADAAGAEAVVEGLEKLATEKGARFNPARSSSKWQAREEVLRMRGAEMSTVKEETTKSETTAEVESFLKTLFQGHIAEDLVFPVPGDPGRREGDGRGVRGRLGGLRQGAPRLREDGRGAPLPARGRQGHGRARRPRDDDSRGVRRQRLHRGRVLPDDGDDRAARRFGVHRRRRSPVDRHQAARPLRERGAEEEVAA